jgi:thiol-disulfide isomerase/thioredoxin
MFSSNRNLTVPVHIHQRQADPMIRFAAGLLLSVVLLVPGIAAEKKKAPALTAKTADGTVVDLAKLRGKVVIVNFWATWCGPCRAEIPDFISAYAEYRTKGLEIIGISLDEGGWADVTPYVQRSKITYPVVLGDRNVARAWGNINAIPTTFILDKEGNIVDSHVGVMTKAQLAAKIKSLL